MEKPERIEAKRQELNRILAGLPDNQREIAADLIDQAAFLAVELEDLNADIIEHGSTETYTNGANQSGRKVSSAAKLYSSLIARYSGIITKLLKLAPDDNRTRRQVPEHNEHIEHAIIEAENRAAEEKKRQKAEQAFMEALDAGKITQDDYYDFMADELARLNEESEQAPQTAENKA